MESISVCGKGGSTLKNTTNTTGSLASLHLGFKLSQDVSSDCFSGLYKLFFWLCKIATHKCCQIWRDRSRFATPWSNLTVLEMQVCSSSCSEYCLPAVDKVKKKKITPDFLHFFPCDLSALLATKAWVVLQSRVHLHSKSRFGGH